MFLDLYDGWKINAWRTKKTSRSSSWIVQGLNTLNLWLELETGKLIKYWYWLRDKKHCKNPWVGLFQKDFQHTNVQTDWPLNIETSEFGVHFFLTCLPSVFFFTWFCHPNVENSSLAGKHHLSNRGHPMRLKGMDDFMPPGSQWPCLQAIKPLGFSRLPLMAL